MFFCSFNNSKIISVYVYESICMFFVIFTKGSNFCDFLFAFFRDVALQKNGIP